MASRTTIDDLGMDLLQNIVSRLPALYFASADCVSRSWNHVCGRVLSRPKLSSACSLNPSLHVAVEEVVNKVLSEPIRPQFAIASIHHLFDMKETLKLITAKLSSKVPIIINFPPDGIIGKDAIYNEFKETLWKVDDEDEKGIMLTVGFVPGVKVKAISLPCRTEEPQTVTVDQFITDIREFSSSVSGCQSPAAIIMFFSEFAVDMDFILRKMDYAMSPETAIVGGCGFDFPNTNTEEQAFVAALVLVMDKNKPRGIGETRFHVVLSTGLSPVGPTYTVNATRETSDGCMTYINVLGEWPFESIDEDNFPTMFIGVIKRRKCSIGRDEAQWMTSLAFHEVLMKAENVSFSVRYAGIREGDTFQLYHPDSNTARSSIDNVSNFLRSFKQRSINGNDKGEVCGGLIFTTTRRGVSLLGQPSADSSVFLEKFPGVTFGGPMCPELIGRGCLIPQESQEQKPARACLHHFSAVYLIISYAP